jgi:excisionase family DNA binding protein
MKDQYLSVDEMQRLYSVSRSTAWRWIREAGIPTYRFVGDRKTYIKREDLALLDQPIPRR